MGCRAGPRPSELSIGGSMMSPPPGPMPLTDDRIPMRRSPPGRRVARGVPAAECAAAKVMTVIRWAVVKDGGGRAPVAKPTGTWGPDQQGRTTCCTRQS